MSRFFLFVCFCALLNSSIAQPTNFVTNPDAAFNLVAEHIQKGEYAFAYSKLKALQQVPADLYHAESAYKTGDVNYYLVVCELALQQDVAVEHAKNYLATESNAPRANALKFYLAHYYFLEGDYENAITYFEQAGLENLSNEQIADAKFETAYSLFNMKRLGDAKPLFNEIHQLPNNKYYIPANYYYGIIAYSDRQYDEALKSFQMVETYDDYKGVVPYYIAEIYYFQKDKERSLTYGENALKNNDNLYYTSQLKLLIGQIYFENKNYAAALPLLEDYVKTTPKVTREILYELSYSYYEAKVYSKAISGFKQLTTEKDSMSQNSMYLLGGLYLKTGEKANARTAFQYSAFNSSNKNQQRVSQFNYAKLSYELGYEDVALKELKTYLSAYPQSQETAEAKELLVTLLANTNNFRDALDIFKGLGKPTANMQKVFPRILFGRAIEYINEQNIAAADDLLAEAETQTNVKDLLPFINFWRGEIAYREARYNDAIPRLRRYIEAGSPAADEANATNAKYNLAYALLQTENYNAAAPYFVEVAGNTGSGASPLAQDALLRAADCFYMLRDFSKASAIYSKVVAGGMLQSDYAYYQNALIAGVKNSNEKVTALNNFAKQYPNSALLQEANMEIALAYIADEKFSAAIPYLNKIVAGNATGLKPKAYLKLGLANYNNNNNGAALAAYKILIQQYAQSDEANEAQDVIRDIYIEEGKPGEYVELMRSNGKTVSVSEADSLTYSSAIVKFNAGDCNGSVASFENYLSKYPTGAYVLEAQFKMAQCYQKAKDFPNALKNYNLVFAKGLSKNYEDATLEAARINYFELKNYAVAKTYFEALHTTSVNQNSQLEALRGLVRSNYFLKEYDKANQAATELVARKGINTDDKSVGFLVLGKSQQQAGNCAEAIKSFASTAAINKTAWGAEARYELAACQFTLANLSSAEKSALAVIKETGSYDEWVTKAYILLGDIFMQQKDYFNAKATFESVAKNATIDALKKQAQQKLEQAIETEKKQSKIIN